MTFVTSARQGDAAVLTFANPPAGTIDHAGGLQMLAAVREAAADPMVRAIVITGGLEGVFIRHYSVGELSASSDRLHAAEPPPQPSEGGESYLTLVDLLEVLPKPVIAAINGVCMGGGFELALACDLRIASPAVTAIGLPETRVGIVPGAGGTQRLPRVVGEAKALEIILRGLTFPGPEAHAIGLLHELADDPVARALELAEEFATRTPEALAAAKALTRAALDRPLAQGLAEERAAFAALLRTEGARTALAASAASAVPLERA